MLLSALAAALALLAPVQALEFDWGAQAEANPTANTTLNQAIDYALPYVYMGRLRASRLDEGAGAARLPLNGGLQHDRQLINATYRAITTPNTDTLYSRAFLDLSAGPANITFPDMAGRYYAVSLLDMSSNVFYIGGRRHTGTLATSSTGVGPDWEGEAPVDARIVKAPANDVLVHIRSLVDDEEDLATAHALQDQYAITMDPAAEPVAHWPGTPPTGATAADFVGMANLMLKRNPPPRHERRLLEKPRPYGSAQWNARLPDVLVAMRNRKVGYTLNGWQYAGALIGDFGSAYYTRSQVAVSGLLALPTEEAMYPFTHTDVDGQPLTGANRYHIPLPAGVPQVGAFWSLTLYEVTPEGSLYFADNEINRYNIGDRTPGLRTNEDGSIDLWIQNEPPTDEAQRANWLPTPKGGFSLFFRAYEPGAEFRDHRAPLPKLVKL